MIDFQGTLSDSERPAHLISAILLSEGKNHLRLLFQEAGLEVAVRSNQRTCSIVRFHLPANIGSLTVQKIIGSGSKISGGIVAVDPFSKKWDALIRQNMPILEIYESRD